jgi:hypothetical protein
MGEYDPVGYIYESSIYCGDCIGDDLMNADETGAIFECNESDSPEHCGQCGSFIPCNLTKYGFRDLEQRICSFQFEYWPDLLEEYLSHWDSHDWHVILTFAGRMDPFGDLKP